MEEISPLKIISGAIAGVLGVVIILGSWFIVSPGFVGVTFNKVTGTTATYQRGLHIKLPLITGVEKFDIRTIRADQVSESASKDLQKVVVEIALNYHLEHDKVNELYTRIGTQYIGTVVGPALHEAVKSTTAQFPVESIIVNREALREKIEKSLSARLKEYNIIVESVNLVNINFDEEFNKVVEQKQIEEQKIKTAEYQKEQERQRAEQTIITAKAEAERNLIEARAEASKQVLLRSSTSRQVIELKYLEKWDGKLPTVIAGKGSNLLLDISSGGSSEEK